MQNSLSETFEYFNGNIKYSYLNDEITLYSLDRDIYQYLTLGDIVGKGVHSRIYEIYIDIKRLRHLNLVVKVPANASEIIIQDIVSKYNISPKIFGFWKTRVNYALVMEKIEGITLNRYIETQDISKVFLKVVKKLLYLGIKLKVSHGDIHLNNIMIYGATTGNGGDRNLKNKVCIIDFASANMSNNIILEDFEDFIDITRRKLYNLQEKGKCPVNSQRLFHFLRYHDHDKFYNKCLELRENYGELYELVYQEFKKNYNLS